MVNILSLHDSGDYWMMTPIPRMPDCWTHG